MTASARHPPAVAATLAAWHRMIASGDLGDLPSLLHPDATFRSPMAFKPYASAKAVNLVLTTAFRVFEGFAYHRELASDDGLSRRSEAPMQLRSIGDSHSGLLCTTA